MKIGIFGSTAYEERMKKHRDRLIFEGHEVRLPALDSIEGLNELGILSYNRALIEWADEIHLIWDGRSLGALLDIGMLFALRKPLVIVYLQKKSILNFVLQYAARCGEER